MGAETNPNVDDAAFLFLVLKGTIGKVSWGDIERGEHVMTRERTMRRWAGICFLLALGLGIPAAANSGNQAGKTLVSQGDHGSGGRSGVDVEAREVVREERTVYVPFHRLDELLGPESRAVVLPYERFLELWGALSPRGVDEEVEEAPPVDVLVASAKYRGRVTGGIAQFTGTYRIEVLKSSGYAKFPLLLQRVAVTRVELDGQVALVNSIKGGMELFVRGAGAHELVVSFSSPVRREGKKSRVSVDLPPVAMASLELEIEGAALEIFSHPMAVASLEAAGATTIARFSVGGLSDVEISWQPQAAKVVAAETALFVTSTQMLSAGKGAIRNDSAFDLQIAQGSVERLLVELPRDFTPLSVEVPGLKGRRAEGRNLVLEFEAPQTGKISLRIMGEQILPNLGEAPVQAPILRLRQAVQRERIFTAILEAPGVKLSAKAEAGAVEVDSSELPHGPRKRGRILRSFLFTAYPGRADLGAKAPSVWLQVEKLEPEIQTEAETFLEVYDDHLEAVFFMNHRIRRSGLFSVAYRLPADLRVTEVGPEDLVRGFRVEAKGAVQTVTVELNRKAEDHLSLRLEAEAERSAADEALVVPAIETLGAKKQRGVVGLAVGTSYDARMGKSAGLFSMSVKELPVSRFPQSGPRPTVLGYRYNALPYSGGVVIQRKQPKVTAEVVEQVSVSEDRLRITATIHYKILYAGVDRLAIEIPADV